MNIIEKIKKTLFGLYIRTHEKKYSNRLKYILFKKQSKDLIVVFSAFPSDNKPRYNYIKSLYAINSMDRLYILDDFGYKGSYYLYEKGNNHPMLLVEGLISNVLSKKKYDRVYMLGSSKGGTCAIYYGLQFDATAVFSGANQYYLGKYLNVPERQDVFLAMIGQNSDKQYWEKELDSVIKRQLCKYKDSRCIIHLLYSKKEHTYDDDIKGMIEDFKQEGIHYTEKEEEFADHGEVGKFFIPWINDYFSKRNRRGV